MPIRHIYFSCFKMVEYNKYWWSRVRNNDSGICEITWKYLFFSDNKSLLKKLGEEILYNESLPLCKVPESDTRSNSKWFWFVLCVYSNNDSLKNILMSKYWSRETIKYRYWKSNESTSEWKYSKEYKKSITI